VAGLCAADPTASSLCRSDCGAPCLALPPGQDTSGGGCSIADGRPGDRSATSPVAPGTWASLAFLLGACALSFTRRARGQIALSESLKGGPSAAAWPSSN